MQKSLTASKSVLMAFVAIALAVVCAFGFAACGEKADPKKVYSTGGVFVGYNSGDVEAKRVDSTGLKIEAVKPGENVDYAAKVTGSTAATASQYAAWGYGTAAEANKNGLLVCLMIVFDNDVLNSDYAVLKARDTADDNEFTRETSIKKGAAALDGANFIYMVFPVTNGTCVFKVAYGKSATDSALKTVTYSIDCSAVTEKAE